jgi:hypothetical protein
MSDGHDSDFAAKLELAWAAGFFDGEGSTFLQKPEKTRPDAPSTVKMSISQVCKGNLVRWQAAVGEGSITGPYQQHGLNARPHWKLDVASGRVKATLDKLWPYLGEEKKRQADAALANGRVARGLLRDRDVCIHGHPMKASKGYIRPNGRITDTKICLTCRRLSAQRLREKRRVEQEGASECPPTACRSLRASENPSRSPLTGDLSVK